MQSYSIRSNSFDPWYNLALEEALYETASGVTLYLWQNQNTVVIGKNQNAWAECRVELLEREGGKLARRTTGGGAVFHDVGNLCFTFVVTREGYDLERQLGVILGAVRGLGIHAEFSGRNDLTIDGRKFSGNAFKHGSASIHHGTILVNADMEKLGRYLSPPKVKLESKGIASVRSRVCNLCEYEKVSISDVSCALEIAFAREYGKPEPLPLPQKGIEELCAKHASWEWRLGETPKFDMEIEQQFDWGGLKLCLSFSGGVISGAKAYSDAMDEAFIGALPEALLNLPFNKTELAAKVASLPRNDVYARDIAKWLEDIEV